MTTTTTTTKKRARYSNQIVGNTGLYYVCFRLSMRGWNVMPTARNARGVDIVAYDADATSYVGVQVKTLSKADPVPLGSSLDHLISHYVVIVRGLHADKLPECFILTPEEVRNRAHCGVKDGSRSYWLQPKQYAVAEFREAWHRIAAEEDGKVLSSPAERG